MKWLIVILCLLLGFALPAMAGAQEPEPPPVLTVTVRDGAGRGIPGIQVLVRDRSGITELGRAVTDVAGQAVFATLPSSDVRVALVGRLGDGTELRQEGDDTPGIALILSLPPNTLDLIVERDGTVIPDPTTMIALDSGVTVDITITTAPATQPAVPPVQEPPPPPIPSSSAPYSPADEPHVWAGIALALVLTGAVAAVLLLVSHWRQGH